MGNGIIDRITDEVWGKKSSVCVILAILLILGGTITSTVYSQMSVIESNTVRTLTQEGVAVLIMLWVSLLILFIWYLVYVYRCNHIRGAQRGKTGIVIYYDCESKGIYQNTVRRLGEEFRDRIQDNFDIIDIPYGVKKPKIYDERTIVDFIYQYNS